MREIYHIEAVGPARDGGRVVERTSMRAAALHLAKERALKVLRRSQTPPWRGPAVEAVRVLDGAGYEVFSASLSDGPERPLR